MLQTLRQPFRSIAAKVRRDKERPVVPQSIEKNSHSDQERPAVPLSTETNARSVQESTNILQSFVSENGTKLVSLPTHLFEDSLDRYLLWIDIQSAFEDIDYLQDSHGSRVQYVPDEDDVFFPFRIEHTDSAYTVFLSHQKQKHGSQFHYLATTFPSVSVSIPTTTHYRPRPLRLHEKCVRALSATNNHQLLYESFDINYEAPRHFLVLPWRGHGSWGTDLSSHKFRLFFMCTSYKTEGLVHFSNHPGYNLTRPYDFFQKYGAYSLVLLTMAKTGVSTGYYEVPPLSTGHILLSHGNGNTEHSLSKHELECLVDISISYIEKLTLPKWTSKDGLGSSATRDIKQYLEVEDGDNTVGNLYQSVRGPYVNWICEKHMGRQKETLQERARLEEFITKRKGYFNWRQATIKVMLGSSTDAERFLSLYTRLSHSTSFISIRLGWRVPRTFLYDFFLRFEGSATGILEVDGVTLENLPQDHTDFGRDVFQELMKNTSRSMVRLINYPQRNQQQVYLRDLTTFVLQSNLVPQRAVQWYDVREAVGDFRFGLIHRGKASNSAALKMTLTALGLPGLSRVIFRNREHTWQGSFDCEKNTIVDVRLFSPEHLTSLISGEWLKLCVDFEGSESISFSAQNFRLFCASPWLLDIHILTQEHDLLNSIGGFMGMQPWLFNRPKVLFYERARDGTGEVLIQLAIGQPDEYTVLYRSPSFDKSGIKVLQWGFDGAVTPLTDSNTITLDALTTLEPGRLKSFMLDVLLLSQYGLGALQRTFQRTAIERLQIRCGPVKSELRGGISRLFLSIPWSCIRSLALTGNNIDEWIQLWRRSWSQRTKCSSNLGGQLLSLVINGTGSVTQKLSHSSVLHLHRVIYSSPVVEVLVENLELEERCDWELLKGDAGLSSR